MMDKEFESVEDATRTNYYTNTLINIIIIALGIGIILISIYHGYTKGVDLFSGVTSAIGVADFISIFLVNPQSRVNKALADRVQMHMIWVMWENQVSVAYLQMIEKYDDNTYKTFKESLAQFTKDAVDAIEKNIG